MWRPNGDQPPAHHRSQGCGFQEGAGDQPAHAVPDEGDPFLLAKPPLARQAATPEPPLQDAPLKQPSVVPVRQPPVIGNHEHVRPGVPQRLEKLGVRPDLDPPAPDQQVDIDQRVGMKGSLLVVAIPPGQPLEPQQRIEEPVQAANGAPQGLRSLVTRIVRPASPPPIACGSEIAFALLTCLLRCQALIDQHRPERSRQEDHPRDHRRVSCRHSVPPERCPARGRPIDLAHAVHGGPPGRLPPLNRASSVPAAEPGR